MGQLTSPHLSKTLTNLPRCTDPMCGLESRSIWQAGFRIVHLSLIDKARPKRILDCIETNLCCQTSRPKSGDSICLSLRCSLLSEGHRLHMEQRIGLVQCTIGPRNRFYITLASDCLWDTAPILRHQTASTNLQSACCTWKHVCMSLQ